MTIYHVANTRYAPSAARSTFKFAVVGRRAAKQVRLVASNAATQELNLSGDSETHTVKGWAVMEAGAKLTPYEYQLGPIGADEIDIEVTHNGLCHTDLKMRDNYWNISAYPFIPGHEVVGIVRAAGSGVTTVKAGDRVGYAWIRGSCGCCRPCVHGYENLCEEGYTGTIVAGNNGGFQNIMRAPAKFAFKIPDAMDSVSAAPLMCAGVTVYAPLSRLLKHPGMRVGVIGIGGLGHLALQFASKMGADVIAISTSKNKEDEAKRLGASRLVLGSESTAELKNKLDVIINTVPAVNNYTEQLSMLRAGGTLCIVGIPVDNISAGVLDVVFNQKKIEGSVVGGRSDMLEMLEFAAAKDIKPICEVMPLSQVNEAMQRVHDNKARYRIVLTTDL